MGKYIDSEKMIALIEGQKKNLSASQLDERGALIAYGVVLGIITILQQEQPQVADASKMEQEMLDVEIAIYLNKNVLNRINSSDIIEDFTTTEAGELARHFAEWGAIYLNAKK